jgi:hypothetical protein
VVVQRLAVWPLSADWHEGVVHGGPYEVQWRLWRCPVPVRSNSVGDVIVVRGVALHPSFNFFKTKDSESRLTLCWSLQINLRLGGYSIWSVILQPHFHINLDFKTNELDHCRCGIWSRH